MGWCKDGCGKWSQDRSGYCRAHAREHGVLPMARRPVVQRPPDPVPRVLEFHPKPLRTIVVEDREYEVMWDGSRR